ncbi:Cerato-platanin [Paxillus ammoniavirescens]|nr:Cerato-platanin [Paxillus ammoniavirescens]
MKFTTTLATLVIFALPSLAATVDVTYSTFYDDPSTSLGITACSNGVNGLQTKYPTLGSIPNFPNVGGIPGLTWNSTLCGSCWQLTYTEGSGQTNTVNIVAVDGAYTFNLSLEAMNTLTGGIAVEKGKVSATAVQVAASVCGM